MKDDKVRARKIRQDEGVRRDYLGGVERRGGGKEEEGEKRRNEGGRREEAKGEKTEYLN